MKKKKITELVFILDKSGSMAGKEEDTIGSFNSTINEQKDKEYDVLVTTVLFSNKDTILHDRINIKDMKPMTRDDYKVNGCTALIDAIGNSVKHIQDIHKYVRKEDVPSKTLFVIITDGLENASSIYSSNEVKEMIEAKKKVGWEFLFLGANIDSVETAKHFGIDESRSINYMCDKKGIKSAYKSTNNFMNEYFVCDSVVSSDAWRKEVDADFKKRKKK